MAGVMAVTSFVQFRLWLLPLEIVIKSGGYIFFLSSFVFALAYLVTSKFNYKVIHIIAIILCAASIFHWFFLKEKVESAFARMTEEITDVKQYNQLLNEYWRSQEYLVSHFPKNISPEAENVKFSFFPSFLQVGANIQLRYSLPSQQIAELYKRFNKEKIKSFRGGDTNVHSNIEGGMPTTFFYTNESGNTEFPEDYEIMVVTAKPEGDKQLEWNHGECSGVAISQKRNEIVYWAESW